MLAHLFRGYPLGRQRRAKGVIPVSGQAVRPRDIEELANLPLCRNCIGIQGGPGIKRGLDIS
jgi:hypothetical protein